MQVRLGRRIRTDACIFDGPAHLHLIDWRLIRCLSANVLSSFCKQECAELVVFGTGCRSTAIFVLFTISKSPKARMFTSIAGFLLSQ